MAHSANYHNAIFGGYEWHQPPDTTGVRLLSVFRVRHRTIHPEYTCQNQDWVFDYFYTPGFKLKVGREDAPWFTREACTVHLYPPGIRFWEDPGRKDRLLHSVWVFFKIPPAFGMELLTSNPTGFARFYDPSRRMDSLLFAIASHARTLGDDGYIDALPPFLEALNLMRRSIPIAPGIYQIPDAPDSAMKHSVIARVQAYFRTHLGENITVPKLAKHVHMTPSALIRRYRLETGLPPMEALSRMRIQVAKTLLVQGHTMKAVADQLGFYDSFHFSKVFKKTEGIPPSIYVERQDLPQP